MNIINAFKYLFSSTEQEAENQEEKEPQAGKCPDSNKLAAEIDKLIAANKKSLEDNADFQKDTIPIKTLYWGNKPDKDENNVIFRSEAAKFFANRLETSINEKDLVFKQLKCKYKEKGSNLSTRKCTGWIDSRGICCWIWKTPKGFFVIPFNTRELYFIDNFSWILENPDGFRYAVLFDKYDDNIRICFAFSTSTNDCAASKLFRINESKNQFYKEYICDCYNFDNWYIQVIKKYYTPASREQIIEDIARYKELQR